MPRRRDTEWPWPKGATVECIVNTYQAVRMGQRFVVDEMHTTAGDWVIGVRNPKYGYSNYYARNFVLVTEPRMNGMKEMNGTNTVESQSHYFAPIGSDGMIDFASYDCRGSYTIMKAHVTGLIKANPSLRFAVWTIAAIAETSAPPVVFNRP